MIFRIYYRIVYEGHHGLHDACPVRWFVNIPEIIIPPSIMEMIVSAACSGLVRLLKSFLI